jgi:hypothetical protein
VHDFREIPEKLRRLIPEETNWMHSWPDVQVRAQKTRHYENSSGQICLIADEAKYLQKMTFE